MVDSFFSSPLTEPAAEAAAEAFLIVRAADELFALPGAELREVIRWRTPTPLPGAPPLLLGIIGQRGVVLPVVDLRRALGLPAGAAGRAARLVLVQHAAIDLALLVDAVLDLAPITGMEHPPHAPERGRAPLLTAVARHQDRPLGAIDLAALIALVQDGLRNG